MARTLLPEEAALAGPVAMAMARAVGDGMVAQAVRMRLSRVPPELACVGLYWQATVAPQSLERELLPHPRDQQSQDLLQALPRSRRSVSSP